MIDSHCHINDPVFIDNPKQYVDEARAAGVEIMLVIGFDLQSSKDAVEIANQFDGVYAAVGLHPSEVKKAGANDLKEIEKLIKNKKVVAIGEIGLDYYWDKEPELRKQQIHYFEQQIMMANKHHLPIVIHSRDAIAETLQVVKVHRPLHGGVLHCYPGSLEMTKDFSKLGLLFGIGGVVTFKNAIHIKDVAKHVDKSLYLLETDSPYLAPTPHRGEVNHSKYLPLIASEIASLRQEDVSEVIKNTNENFKRLFRI